MLPRYLSIAALISSAFGQGSPQPGITVFQSLAATDAVAVDLAGNVVNTWPGVFGPGNAVYLAPNGDLVRTLGQSPGFGAGGNGGGIQRVSWDNENVWRFHYSSPTFHTHHDIALMPNGNVLMIAWDVIGNAGAVDAGRNPNNLAQNFVSEEIIEIEPNGQGGASIVWRWRAFDHLVQNFDSTRPSFGNPADNPGRIDLNYMPGGFGFDGDWLHYNGIDYNAELDQIVMSNRNFSEVWIIDHSTTSAEAAGTTGGNSGRGGDLLYRWGNPAAYGQGTALDRTLFGQHDPQWIQSGRPGAGNLLIFNNGVGRPAGQFSSADEVITPLNAGGTYDQVPGQAFGPAAAAWVGTHPNPLSFFSPITSGAERQPNGNTMMVAGLGAQFIEIDSAGALVWSLTNPALAMGVLFKARRLPGGVTGVAYCDPAVQNSTGQPGTLHVVGSRVADENALTLFAQSLPPSTFGMFVNGTGNDMTPLAGGSAGTLCLSGIIGRYSAPSEVFLSDSQGNGSLAIDLTSVPTAMGPTTAMAGDTYYFQCWYRDTGTASSNFTNAVQIDLQ